MNHTALGLIAETYDAHYGGVEKAAQAIESEFKSFRSDVDFVDSRSATVFVLGWMRDHFRFQKRFDSLFNRKIMQSSADQFTAVLALTLKGYLNANNVTCFMQSERALFRQRGTPRPDISLWVQQDTCIAVIECKTNLGYNRAGWKKQYDERTRRFQQLHPNCSSYLCVLTKSNWKSSWNDFSGSSLKGDKWYCLSELWPSDVGEYPETHVIDPIEPMFVQIREALVNVPRLM